MPATIRLKRVGRKKQSAFRIVVADSSTAVEGPSIERLGIYQPRTEPSVIELDAARTLHWLRAGAKPTDTVRSLLRTAGVWEKFHAGVSPEDLEEVTVTIGPVPGQRQTSRRVPKGAAEEPAAGAKEKPAAKAEAAAAAPTEAEEAEQVEEEAEAEAEAEPEAAGEAEESEEAAAEPEEEAAAEEPEASAEAAGEAAEEEEAEEEEAEEAEEEEDEEKEES